MAYRDYWVYQKRDVAVPWALYIVKEFDKRAGKDATMLSFTVYHEDIATPTHSVTHDSIHCESVSAYVRTFIELMSESVYLDDADQIQVKNAIEDILFS